MLIKFGSCLLGWYECANFDHEGIAGPCRAGGTDGKLFRAGTQSSLLWYGQLPLQPSATF